MPSPDVPLRLAHVARYPPRACGRGGGTPVCRSPHGGDTVDFKPVIAIDIARSDQIGLSRHEDM